jgi:L-fuconolactonase
MTIVDAQVHAWTPQHDPEYPWNPEHKAHGFFETEKTPDRAEQVIADMDEAGVDAALLVVPTLYLWDNSYATDSARRYPGRLAVVARIDWKAPEPVRRLEELMADPTVVGIRLAKRDDPGAWAADGEFGPMLSAAEELDVPVAGITGTLTLSAWGDVARRHPDLRLIVDHLGLEAPPTTVPVPGPAPFERLPHLLALAEHPNVYVKMTATPALSNEPFPFRDIWPAIATVVSEFGADRVMWGSDYNRTSSLHTYSEAVRYLAEADVFDDATKATLYAGTARRVYGWPSSSVESGPLATSAKERTS